MEILGDSREFQGLTCASRQGGRGRLPRARMWEPARVPKGGLTARQPPRYFRPHWREIGASQSLELLGIPGILLGSS